MDEWRDKPNERRERRLFDASARGATAERLPRLSAGSVQEAARCLRRLARTLDPSPSPSSRDSSMRLRRSITDALIAAHEESARTATSIENHLLPRPPTSLSVEEGAQFTTVVEHYLEAFADDGAVLHSRAGASLSRPSSCGRFMLTGKAELLFTLDERTVLRRFIARPQPFGDRSPTWADLAYAALLVGPGRGGLLVQSLWYGPPAGITTHEVNDEQVAEFRAMLLARVDEAIAAGEDGPTEAGWWCTTCRFVKECPAIPQDSLTTLLLAPRFAPVSSEHS